MARRMPANQRIATELKDPVGGLPSNGEQAVVTRYRQRGIIPNRVALPPEVTEERPDLVKAQEQSRVEILMLKGVRQHTQIAALLNMDVTKCKKLVEQVHARWEITANGSDLRRHRGEALAKLDLVENELWNIVANKEDDRAKVVALNNIMLVHDRRMPLLGLNPNSIAAMGNEGGAKADFAKAMQGHRSAKDVAKRFLQIIEGHLPQQEGDGQPKDITPTRPRPRP